MKIEILTVTPEAEKLIEEAGRTCYKSQEKMGEDTHSGFIRRLIKSGHLSVLEHASVTIRLTGISRALTHQLVRHRHCSFSQKSQRYVSEEGFDYIIPPKIEKDSRALEIYRRSMENIGAAYKELIDAGIIREDARYVLPNSCETEIVFSCNFRELRLMIELRGELKAQWEIRKVFIEILEQMRKIAPDCFYDFVIDKEKNCIRLKQESK